MLIVIGDIATAFPIPGAWMYGWNDERLAWYL
jgi:hypothetical protein